jgi:hypothetical protein
MAPWDVYDPASRGREADERPFAYDHRDAVAVAIARAGMGEGRLLLIIVAGNPSARHSLAYRRTSLDTLGLPP